MNTVSSTLIYGGQNIPWTTNNASIMPFSIPRSHLGTSSWNLTTTAIAHTAHLDCRVLGSSDFELAESNLGNWFFSIRDRGCSWKDQVFAQISTRLYTHILGTYWTECNDDAYHGRVVVVGAQLPEIGLKLTNKIGISCIPSYYNVTGTLNVTSDRSSPMGFAISSFTSDPSNAVRIDPYPVFGSSFARQLFEPKVSDPTNKLLTNSFGSLVFYATENFSAEALLNVTESLYVAAFAVMTQKFLIQPSSSTANASGTILTEEIRLVVVPAVAYTVVGILAAILAMLAWIWWYTREHRSILIEESIALVGAAVNLRKSVLMAEIEGIDADQWEGQVANAFEFERSKQDPQRGWRIDRWTEPGKMSIVSTARARK